MTVRRWPIAVRIVDIASPIDAMPGVAGYPRTRVYILEGGELIDAVDIWNAGGPISAATLRGAIARRIVGRLTWRAREREGLPPARTSLGVAPFVSVVVPTCGRPDDLRRCLASLQSQATACRVEIVVVDNRPGQHATADVVREFPGVVLVIEPRPGLSYARNAGFLTASGDVLVAIDDDVTVPAGWLDRLVGPFSDPSVMAVTGNVVPVELETEAQCVFEAYGGLGKGFDRVEVDGEWFRGRRTAVPTWLLGATANAAFRASIFRDPAIGLLDEALGAGTPTGCSEDTYLFYRILKAGHRIVYEPGAWVWHRHRVDAEALDHQIFSYSKGHVAYQLTTLFREGDRRALVRLLYSLPKIYLRRIYARLRGWSDYPVRFVLLEIAGNLAGPLALWRARRRVRRLGRSSMPGSYRQASVEQGPCLAAQLAPGHGRRQPGES